MTWALRVAVAGLVWTGFVLEARMTLAAHRALGAGPFAALAFMLGYFTVLANAIAALSLAVPLLLPRSAVGRFLSRASIVSGLTLSMVVVGFSYGVLLHGTWSPAGPQQVANLFLRTLSPWGYFIYWSLGVPRQDFRVRDMGGWFVIPTSYAVVTLSLGIATGAYPYFFLDVGRWGVERVLVNCAWLGAGFVAAAFGLVGLDRMKPRADAN